MLRPFLRRRPHGEPVPAAVLACLLGCLLTLPLAACTAGHRTTPTATASTRAPASVPGGAAGPRSVSLVATGDVLLHPPLVQQAGRDAGPTGGLDFAPELAGVRELVSSADLAVCHLETPLAPPGGPYRGYPSFSVPPQVVPALRATGYDACTTASNHSFDQGPRASTAPSTPWTRGASRTPAPPARHRSRRAPPWSTSGPPPGR